MRRSATYSLRDLFNGLRWMVRTGAPWRYLPNDFPPWTAVYQQARRWMAAGVFEALVHDLRAVLRICADRSAQPTAVIFDGRVMQSTPESGAGRLRRLQTQEGLQNPHGRRHAGESLGVEGDGS